MQINYRDKYKELKLKLKNLTDLSFRLGVEEGMRQSQVQQAQEAQQAAEQQAQMSAQQGQPGQPGPDGQMPGQSDEQGSPEGQQVGGSELDNHISELESMLQKMEKGSDEYLSLKKSLDKLQSFNVNQKAQGSINAIAKALKKPFALSHQATKNMNEPAKKALNLQEQLVNDVMKGWADEEASVLNQVNKTLGIEGILNKD